MADILAPSKQGYVDQKVSYEAFWGVRPSPPTTRVTGNPVILRSYKGPTSRSDGKRPTNYVRMIGRVVPGSGADCWNNTYSYRSTTSAEALAWNPHGSNFFTGSVGCPEWMTNKVIMDALADLNQLNANIFEDLFQLRETVKPVVDIIKTMWLGFRLAKAREWGTLRRMFKMSGVNIPRRVSQGWLIYFYGIKPLISTIEALTEKEPTMLKTLKVRKRISQAVSALPYFNGSYYHQFEGKANIQAQCELKASIKLSGNIRSWHDLGLTSSQLNDAVVTAYALVPYSFVVDWFIPIEAWLRSLVWSPFLVYQGGYTGKRHDVWGRITNLWPWSGVWPYNGKLPQCTLQVRMYQRTTYPYVVPQATLSLRLSLSETQIISASALLTGLPRF